MVSDAAYPYTSGKTNTAGTCRNDIISDTNVPKLKVVRVDRCKNLINNTYVYDECLIDQWYGFLKKGPFSISVFVVNDWFYYTKGILSVASCTSTSSNHAVIAVGWNRETAADGTVTEFAIVRNSWNTTWGENGYIRIKYQPELLNKGCFTNKRAFLPNFQ
jgi:C1A family cysteine protease